MTVLPLNYDEARACTALAECAHEVDVLECGERGASTLQWWRSILEDYHLRIEPLNWQVLIALPRAALWPRLVTLRRKHTRHTIERIKAANPERTAHVG